ncbi:ABC-2 family transporter protein [Mesobacillus thioparans]
MSLTKINLWDIVKKQFRFKLKSYRGMFTSLMILQIIGILFSLGGEGGGGGGSDTFSYDMRNYSGNIILAFMMIWAFISAIVVTTQAYRFDDYAFVANRLSSHLANILFLGWASVIGGVTFLLASQSLKLSVLFLQEREFIESQRLSTLQMAEGLAGTILYLFLFTALGYLVGILVQRSRIFIIILPALFFGSLFVNAFFASEPTLLIDVGQIFVREASFLLFLFKAVSSSIIAFGFAIWISNSLEVRK